MRTHKAKMMNILAVVVAVNETIYQSSLLKIIKEEPIVKHKMNYLSTATADATAAIEVVICCP